MAERKELLAIYRLLDNKSPPDNQVDNKSELELLRNIVTTLESGKSDKRLDKDNLPDSLAFPRDTRDGKNLIEATDIWDRLEKFNNLLRSDYTCRRQMLLKRLDCTVESFKWKGNKKQGDDKPLHAKAKSLNDQIHERYDNARSNIRDESQVSMSDLLAIRDTQCDRILNGVVSTESVDCQIPYGKQRQGDMINLKQVIIPHVPDRGGRTDEVRPPPKETHGHQRGGGFRENRGHNRSRHK